MFLQIVGCSSTACLVMNKLTAHLSLVGSVLLPEISLEGNSIIPATTDASALMYASPDGSILFIPCQYTVHPERAVAWVSGLLNHVQPSFILVLGCLKVWTLALAVEGS